MKPKNNEPLTGPNNQPVKQDSPSAEFFIKQRQNLLNKKRFNANKKGGKSGS